MAGTMLSCCQSSCGLGHGRVGCKTEMSSDCSRGKENCSEKSDCKKSCESKCKKGTKCSKDGNKEVEKEIIIKD